MTKGIGLSDVQREERKVVEELRERVVELEKQLAEINLYFKDFDGDTFNAKFHSLCRYYEDMMDEQETDYKSLEKQLADKDQRIQLLCGSAQKHLDGRREAEKRETVLREALEWLLPRCEFCYEDLKHLPERDCGICQTISAALEVE